MQISIAEAEGQLTELVRLANQGEEVVLTQDGLGSVRLQPVQKSEFDLKMKTSEEKARLLDRLQEEIRKMNLSPGEGAARSQDFLYDEYGLPK